MITVELTKEELVEIVNWGDHFVEWEKGKGSSIEQNAHGLETAGKVHDKLFSILAENM